MKLVSPCPDGTFWISQKWGENPSIYSRWGFGGHNGWDYAVNAGTALLACAAGRVTVVGWDQFGYGLWIELEHAFGRTRLAHGTPDSAVVHVGQDVEQGALLMSSGNSGFSSGPHTHFEIRISDTPERHGVEFYPTRGGAFCIDPGPFLPAPHGEARDLGGDTVDDRIGELQQQLKAERARAELNYTKMIDAMADLGFTVRAMNRAGDALAVEDQPKLQGLNEKWIGKI